MADRQVVLGGGATVDLPEGWIAEADEEGGVNLMAEDGPGLLHLVSFEQEAGAMDDPADELYAFLEDQGIELEDDEVDDVELAGGAMLAMCEYMTELDPEENSEGTEDDDDDEASTFWLIGVATAPGNLLFGSYSCAAGDEDLERETVRGILRSVRLRENL
ncbi:hypothetical protein BH23GEM6_BH23GEM6_07970 [soil metagenome]